MGITHLRMQVADPANPDVTEEMDLLVDSGATCSVVPAAVLERLGIRPIAEETFRLADGSRIRRRRGVALFKYRNRIGGAGVIFGEDGDSALLGATTLEEMGLAFDPLRRELKEMPMMLSLSSIGRDG